MQHHRIRDVTTGIGPRDHQDRMPAEPFEPFEPFTFALAAVYQLGNVGTARRKLWGWQPKR